MNSAPDRWELLGPDARRATVAAGRSGYVGVREASAARRLLHLRVAEWQEIVALEKQKIDAAGTAGGPPTMSNVSWLRHCLRDYAELMVAEVIA